MNTSNDTDNTVKLNRIIFGQEPDDEGDGTCPDCGVGVEQHYKPCCDQEICSVCGVQLLSCECDGTCSDDEPAYDAPRSLESSEIGRRLVRVTELLNGLRAIPGGAAAALLVQEALREVAAISESDVRVMERIVPF